MQDIETPKIILNEDYLDLRNYPDNNISSWQSNAGTYSTRRKDNSIYNSQINRHSNNLVCSANTSRRENYSTRTSNLNTEGLQFEKELINCGLRKLVNSYNATASANMSPRPIGTKKLRKENSMFDPRFHRIVVPKEKHCLKSQSEVSVNPNKVNTGVTCTSAPLFPSKKVKSKKVDQKAKYEPQKNKCTMTKDEFNEGIIIKPSKRSELRKRRSRSNSKEFERKENLDTSLSQEYKVKQYVDPRLQEKYSVLKMPWKGTWTIPVFSPKSSALQNNQDFDNFDRQTYLYDDGTDIDSACIENQQSILNKLVQDQCMNVLFLGGSICGILLVTLLIWLIFGNDFFHIFLKPKVIQDTGIKYALKYAGGGIIYIITSIVRTIGTILTLPNHQVYRAPPEPTRWPEVQQ